MIFFLVMMESLEHRQRRQDVGISDVQMIDVNALRLDLVRIRLELPDRRCLDIKASLRDIHL